MLLAILTTTEPSINAEKITVPAKFETITSRVSKDNSNDKSLPAEYETISQGYDNVNKDANYKSKFTNELADINSE